MNLDRRTLLIGGGAGVGLVLAFALWPRRMSSELALKRGESAFGNFIKIARDGRVTVAVPQVETGQGIWTALPQVVAEELGAAWEAVAVEPAPLTGAYDNPLVGDGPIRVTAASTSVRAFEKPLRGAAAAARTLLVGAAAHRWNVNPAECEAADGFVINEGRRFSFGELAEQAAERSPPRTPTLRSSSMGRAAGTALPRLDGPAKIDGSWRFAADVRLPEMLFASARLAPPSGRLTRFSRDAIASIQGVRHVSARDAWLAVAADSWWAAEQALKAAGAKFSAAGTAPDPRPLFERALASGDATDWFSAGDYDEATRDARELAATYYVAPTQHLSLEPLSATARFTGGHLEVWAPTLAPDAARAIAQQAAGDARVTLYPMPVGDPGGRALEADAIPLAVELARATRQPVQLSLSQSASQNGDRTSGGALARTTALPGPGGITAAWKMRVAAAGGFGAALSALQGEQRPASLSKADRQGSTPSYAIPNISIEAIDVAAPYQAGYMRGSPEREFAFFIESFVDELARAAGLEPLAFRMAMLGANGRLARCLQGAARLARWDGGGPGSTMGIAGFSAFGSHIGLVANASIGADQRVKVERLVAAVDCGRAINSGLVAQQIEAGLIWGLAQATVPAPEWIGGMPRARAIGGIALPRIADAPEVVVEIIPSSEAPGGVSGLGAVAVAPAVANAVYAGSGKRMRSLPFDPMAIA